MAAPTGVEAAVQPASALQAPEDLRQRIDALLREQATEPSDPKEGPVAVPLAATQERTVPEPTRGSEPVVAPSGEENLTSQIDALFQQMQGNAPSTPPLSGPPAGPETGATPAGAASAQASAPAAAEEKDETALTVEEIDRILAEQADSRFTKELDRAGGAQAGTAEVAKAPPAHTPFGDDPGPSGKADPLAGLAALAGAGSGRVYVSDEGVRTQPLPPRGATAADVARELDQQTEHPTRVAAGMTGGQEPPAQARPGTGEGDLDQPLPLGPSPKTLKQRVRGVFLKLNRPLERFSPATRDTIGYFALLHLFVGSVLIFAKVLGII
jgi:hypothetical protein